MFLAALLFGFILQTICVPRNVTFDDNDPAALYVRDLRWVSKTGRGAYGGGYREANSTGAVMVFTFPQPAIAFFWQGLKRNGPAMFSICVDCDGNAADDQIIRVDGFDPNATDADDPVIIGGVTGLSNQVHTMNLVNLFDARFQTSGVLTIDAFLLTVDDDLTTGASSSVASSTRASSSGSSQSAPTGNPPKSLSSAGSLTSGEIAGAVIVSIAGAFVVGGIAFYCLRRRNKLRQSIPAPYKRASFTPLRREPEPPTMSATVNDNAPTIPPLAFPSPLPGVSSPSLPPGAALPSPPSGARRGAFDTVDDTDDWGQRSLPAAYQGVPVSQR